MRHTCFIRTIAHGAVAAGALVLFTGGPALADHHLGGPGDIGYDPQPADPQLTISTEEVVEGTGGTNQLTFVLKLDKPASGGEGIKFFTQDTVGSANPIEDHEPVLTYVSFAAGETEQTAAVPVVTDSTPEANEHVMVGVSSPAGLNVVDDASSGIIVDDDGRPVPGDPPDRTTIPQGPGDLGTGRGAAASGDGQTLVIGGGPSHDPTGPPTELDARLASEAGDHDPERSSALDVWMLAGVSVLLVGIYLARTRLARR